MSKEVLLGFCAACLCELVHHTWCAAGQLRDFSCCLQIAPTQDDEAIVWQAQVQADAQVIRYAKEAAKPIAQCAEQAPAYETRQGGDMCAGSCCA